MRQLDEAVRASEAQVRIARSERIPSLVDRLELSAAVFPVAASSRVSEHGVNNWTRRRVDELPDSRRRPHQGRRIVAQAGLQQARAQREQTRQFAALDTRVALNAARKRRKRCGTRAAARPSRRSARTRSIRCAISEGISTQTDLSQSRLLLEQARANRAQAARNLAVAQVRLALLKDLPLQSSGAAGAGASSQQQQQQQQQQPTQQRSPAHRRRYAGGTTGGIQP